MAWSGSFDSFNNSFSDIIDSFPDQNHGPKRNGRQSGAGQPEIQMTGIAGRTSVVSLLPGINSNILVCVIINKGEPRSVRSKKGVDRSVMSMTVRDTPVDFINVSCWGNEAYIKDLSAQFHIGDVVEISNAVVQSKALDGSDERYRPWTPSPYQLTLGETRSTLKLHAGWDLNVYSQLSHIPVKASNDFYTIADIQANSQNITAGTVNLQACVKYVGQVREISTKTGRRIKRCEVKLFDETGDNFPIVLWDEELINMAQTWLPKENVIFVADAKVTYDDFRKALISTATSKTIITVNPDTREAHSLYMYGQMADTIDEEAMDFKFDTDIDLSTISDVYTVEQVKSMQANKVEPKVTTGIIYGRLTSYDIDSDKCNLIVKRCCKCHQRLDAEMEGCINMNCPLGSATNLDGMSDADVEKSYNLLLSVSDHTGTLANCPVVAFAAQQLIGYTVDDFLCLSSEKKTELKWKNLLEMCQLHFKMVQLSKGPVLKILACQKADLRDAIKYL